MSLTRHASSQASRGIEPWPRGVSREPTMSIGTAVSRLKTEFPKITPSKVRFLEEQGVVTPHRSAAGYRRFSEADIERLRFCLTSQRDTFQPIRKIVAQLAALDAGHEAEVVPSARVVVSDGELVAPVRADLTVTARELCDLTGITTDKLDTIVAAGLVTPDTAGYFPQRAIAVVSGVEALHHEGIAPRNLRYLKTMVVRHADLIDQVTSGGRANRSGADTERRLARNGEMAELMSALATELLRQEIATLE